jgi:hypothetical protein
MLGVALERLERTADAGAAGERAQHRVVGGVLSWTKESRARPAGSICARIKGTRQRWGVVVLLSA